MHKLKRRARILMITIWVGLLLLSGYIMFKNEITLPELSNILEKLLLQLHQSNWRYFLPISFVLVFILRPLFLLPTWIMNVVAYILFGPWWGYFWVILAEQLSAGIFYFVVKYLAGDIFKQKILKLAHKVGIDVDSSLEKEFSAVLVLRLASLPFDFVTAFSALIGIPFKQFILATFLVSLPWVGLFFLTFESFSKRSIESGLMHTVIFLLFGLCSYIVARRSGIIRGKIFITK